MPNMSYCRMENTFNDLRDAYNHWDEVSSDSEKEYQEKLLQMCRRIINAFDEEGQYISHNENETTC